MASTLVIRTGPGRRTLDHEGLLTLARKVHAAASDGDVERLVENLDDFAHALVDHVRLELPALSGVAPADARILRRGQARVAAAAQALLRQAGWGCGGSKEGCAARAEELVALLTLQAHDELMAFGGPGARTRPEGRWRRWTR